MALRGMAAVALLRSAVCTGESPLPEIAPYNCQVEYDNGAWKTGWTPEWKAYCCETEQRGCPPTTTSTVTTSTVTTSTSTTPDPEGCSKVCELDDVNATCSERIVWAAGHEKAKAKEPCRAAHKLVLGQCDKCSGCALEVAHCKDDEDEKDEGEKEQEEGDEDAEVDTEAAAVHKAVVQHDKEQTAKEKAAHKAWVSAEAQAVAAAAVKKGLKAKAEKASAEESGKADETKEFLFRKKYEQYKHVAHWSNPSVIVGLSMIGMVFAASVLGAFIALRRRPQRASVRSGQVYYRTSEADSVAAFIE